MNKPKLQSTQYALLVVDIYTGIVLNTDLQYFLSDGKDVYLVFDDLQSVRDFISQLSQKSNVYEYHIYDSDYTLIDSI